MPRAVWILLILTPLTASSSLAQPRAALPVTVIERDPTAANSISGRLAGLGPFVVTKDTDEGNRTGPPAALVLASVPDDRRQTIDRLTAARRRGVAIVVAGRAAIAWPDSREYSKLLGRTSVKPSTVAAAATPVVVEILDQKHAITQCITHFRHQAWPAGVEVGSDSGVSSAVLGRTLPTDTKLDTSRPEGQRRPKSTPAIWRVGATFRFGPRGRGPVLVTTLDPHAGPSADLVMTLIGRAIEHGSRQEVTTRIRGKFELAAEKLGPDDRGALPGLPPRPGFFRGRQISQVMSFHGADWLIREDREESEKPDSVIKALGVGPGQTIVDLGCGNGYFTLRMAKKVGATGKVLGVDIQPQMLTLLKKRAAEQGITNVVPVLATVNDSKLPKNAADLILMVDVYHELSNPPPVLEAVRRSLKKTGRVALVEYRGEDPTVRIKPLHRTTVRQMRAELEKSGFRFIENKAFLPYQHILIFGKG